MSEMRKALLRDKPSYRMLEKNYKEVCKKYNISLGENSALRNEVEKLKVSNDTYQHELECAIAKIKLLQSNVTEIVEQANALQSENAELRKMLSAVRDVREVIKEECPQCWECVCMDSSEGIPSVPCSICQIESCLNYIASSDLEGNKYAMDT